MLIGRTTLRELPLGGREKIRPQVLRRGPQSSDGRVNLIRQVGTVQNHHLTPAAELLSQSEELIDVVCGPRETHHRDSTGEGKHPSMIAAGHDYAALLDLRNDVPRVVDAEALLQDRVVSLHELANRDHVLFTRRT